MVVIKLSYPLRNSPNLDLQSDVKEVCCDMFAKHFKDKVTHNPFNLAATNCVAQSGDVYRALSLVLQLSFSYSMSM